MNHDTTTYEALLVEDDPNYRLAIQLAFRDDKHYRFIEASSLEAGLATIEKKPDLRVILLDLSFKHGTGERAAEQKNVESFLGQLRQRPGYYKVIVLTARDDILSAEEASEYGVFNYLPKAESFTDQAIRFSVEQA